MIYLLEDDDSIRDFVIYTLNSQGMEAKGFPPEYKNLLLEDVIIETCFMAAINGRCQECAQSA